MKGANLIRKLVDLALEEDLAFGDITASLTVPEDHTSAARIIARQALVMCGCDVLPVIIQEGRWSIELALKVEDGQLLSPDSVIADLKGLTRELLAAERTILNFLQRLCGVATYTRDFCSIEPGLVVLDTRKTLPGWRVLDKYAVRVGGGRNHRFCLGDMVLVKNNHIDAHAQGMRGALRDIAANKPVYMPWEVEVRNIDELRIALEYKPTIIMLDNFTDTAIVDAVQIVRAASEPPMIEVSGGITRERLAAIRLAGADAVSVGALTTQAPNVDISMRIGA
ncbi:MAG: carboxylating nicotinate-nucleotide diphosphorylase [Pseudomonadota bacterium]|jgi:nicotinate-nucleotide pyrophosphorylase (carboxylating)